MWRTRMDEPITRIFTQKNPREVEISISRKTIYSDACSTAARRTAAFFSEPSTVHLLPHTRTMATTTVTVTVPDGINAGDEFVLEYDGQQLSVVCPDGCAGGDEINLEVPAGNGGGGGAQVVEITVPDGCFPGMEFTVAFEGKEFNIAVPDGVSPGEAIQVEVPASDEKMNRKAYL